MATVVSLFKSCLPILFPLKFRDVLVELLVKSYSYPIPLRRRLPSLLIFTTHCPGKFFFPYVIRNSALSSYCSSEDVVLFNEINVKDQLLTRVNQHECFLGIRDRFMQKYMRTSVSVTKCPVTLLVNSVIASG